jgi:hypothetical protein
MHGDPTLWRKVFLSATTISATLTMVVAVILTVLALTVNADLADRMAEVAAVFGGLPCS